jgi:hypothetical protein
VLVAMADIVRELGLKGLFRGTVRFTERHMQHREKAHTRPRGLCHLVFVSSANYRMGVVLSLTFFFCLVFL